MDGLLARARSLAHSRTQYRPQPGPVLALTDQFLKIRGGGLCFDDAMNEGDTQRQQRRGGLCLKRKDFRWLRHMSCAALPLSPWSFFRGFSNDPSPPAAIVQAKHR